jgi:hypothetical protein
VRRSFGSTVKITAVEETVEVASHEQTVAELVAFDQRVRLDVHRIQNRLIAALKEWSIDRPSVTPIMMLENLMEFRCRGDAKNAGLNQYPPTVRNV